MDPDCPGVEVYQSTKNARRDMLKNLCIITKALGLGMDGREKARDATGAAMTVRKREPAKRPGRVSSPREMAPSSRRGSTTK